MRPSITQSESALEGIGNKQRELSSCKTGGAFAITTTVGMTSLSSDGEYT